MAATLKYDRNKQNFESRDAALTAVLRATGGDAKVLELYKLLTAEQAAQFLVWPNPPFGT